MTLQMFYGERGEKVITLPCEGGVAMAGFVVHPNFNGRIVKLNITLPREGKVSSLSLDVATIYDIAD